MAKSKPEEATVDVVETSTAEAEAEVVDTEVAQEVAAVEETPVEAAEQPEPEVEQPEPEVEQPEPTVEEPEPTVEEPEPEEKEKPSVKELATRHRTKRSSKPTQRTSGLRKKETATVYSTDVKTVKVASNTLNITFDELVRRKYGTTVDNVSDAARDVMGFLDRYQNVMSNREITEETGMSLQRQLYRTYLKIFTMPDIVDRNVCMEFLLWKFFDKEMNAFQPVPLARFTRKGNWDIHELLMFNSLNSIFDKIKDPGTRFAQLGAMRLGEIVQRFPADKAIYTEGFVNWTQSMR